MKEQVLTFQILHTVDDTSSLFDKFTHFENIPTNKLFYLFIYNLNLPTNLWINHHSAKVEQSLTISAQFLQNNCNKNIVAVKM